MNARGIFLIGTLLAAGLLCSAGCMSSQAPEDSMTVVPPITTIIPPAPTTAGGIPLAIPSVSPLVPATANVTPAVTESVDTPLPVTTTWIPKSYGKDTLDNPQITLFSVVKESLAFEIPDCGMRVAFPQAAGDPAYGIRQPVPKLVLLAEEEITAFIDTYAIVDKRYPDSECQMDPNAIGGAACAGVPANPVWNFVRINTTFVPRNTRPGEYDIGFNIKSRGIVIGQLRMNRTFTIDQPIILVRYIPLRVDEMDAFDSIELVFARRD